MNRLGLLLILFLLISPLLSLALPTTSANFSATAQWEVTPSYNVAPGETLVPAQVTLTYNGEFTLYNVIIKPYNFPAISPFTSNTTYEISKIEPGQQLSLVFLVNISPSIPLGVYNFYISIYNSSIVFPDCVVSAQLPVLGYMNLYATAQTSSILFPGERDVPIDITIYDTGSVSAADVTLFLNSSYPIQFVTKEVKVPEISTTTPATVQVLANVYSNATVGTYQLKLTALVFGTLYKSLNVSVSINSNQTVEGKLLNPSVIDDIGSYQDNVPINLQLEYTGPVEINSYSIIITLPQGFTNESGGNEIIINGGSVQPNEIIPLTFSVNTKNINLTSYTFPIKIIWNAVEGEGEIVSVVQYTSFTLIAMGNNEIQITPLTSILYSNSINNVTILLTNQGSGNIYNVTLSVSSPQASILSYKTQIPEIKAGQSVAIPIELFVPETLQGNSLSITISLNYLNSVYEESQYSQELGFYVASKNYVPILISLNPPILSPGEFQSTQLILQNTLNTTLYNVSISLSSQGIYLNNTVFEIHTISPHGNYTVPIELFSSSPGTYTLTVSASYFDSLVQNSEELNIPIYFSQLNAPSVPILLRLNYTVLTSDILQNAKILITNTLNEPIYNVTISLSPQGEIYVNNTIITIPELKPLETLSIPIQVYVGTTGIVSISSSMSYYISGQQKESEELINSLAAGSVDLVVTSVTTLNLGTIVSVTGTIYNFGTGSANGLIVIAEPTRGLEVVGQNTYYVGNLGPDTSSTFTFAFRILNVTAFNRTAFNGFSDPSSFTRSFANFTGRVFLVPIEFVYTNDIGQVIHTYSNITIHVTNSSETFTFHSTITHGRFFTFIGILIVVVIVIVIVVVLLLRRRRKE
ncbi:hypothetical protein [Sulfurisphaera ohwakuensis]|uniref:COG1361 S-layer family protein n=1 Tax=Sulfurisphaera ohwakuensis TaxID=69656 RepID=UPI0036F3688B